MAEISVDTAGMKTQEGALQSVIMRLEKAETELSSVEGVIARHLVSEGYESIRKGISQVSMRIEKNRQSVQSMQTVLGQGRGLYRDAENKSLSCFGKSGSTNR